MTQNKNRELDMSSGLWRKMGESCGDGDVAAGKQRSMLVRCESVRFGGAQGLFRDYVDPELLLRTFPELKVMRGLLHDTIG